MPNRSGLLTGAILALVSGGLVHLAQPAVTQKQKAAPAERPHDAVADAQTPRNVPEERPEQHKTAHDNSDVFAPGQAPPVTEAVVKQKDKGRYLGFDFYLDPIGAKKPRLTFEE